MANKTNIVTKLAIFIFIAVFVGTTAAENIIYVDDDATGSNDGSSWENAYRFLQDALVAASDGDEIRVAQGVYKPDQGANQTPGDWMATFELVNGYGVTIKGGYAGYGGLNPDERDIDLYETILSGDLYGNDVDISEVDEYEFSRAENSYHVISSDGFAIIDGLTITGGNANGSSHWYGNGGALYNSDSVQITNCTFTKNSAIFSGGAIYNHRGDPNIVNCTFTKNWAGSGGGGGIHNSKGSPSLINCTFIENSASEGGGMSNDDGNPTLTNCAFIENVVNNGGGGIYSDDSSPTLINCAFIGNSAGSGGGMNNFNRSGSTPIVRNCLFSGNRAYRGGGIYNYWGAPILTNCTFAWNSSDDGNALYCRSVHERNTVKLFNCILWDGGNEIWNNDLSIINVTYSNIRGGWFGEGNIDEDPLFVDISGQDNILGTEDDNFRLSPLSPCVDSGDPDYIPEPNETDLDGNRRTVNNRIDMGAYELQGIIYVDDDATGANDGTSWINAFNYLQDALATASAGNEIRVAQGVYTPDSNSVIPDGTGDREATFQLTNDISLIGGYAGIGSTNPDARDIKAYQTILSGDLNGNDADVNNPDDLVDEPTREENSYHVVTSISNVILDGFTITCGNANELLGGRGVSNNPYNNGGGIYNLEGQLSLVNCTLTRNFANVNGGGMYDGDNELNLINCTFTGNSARTGGGIYDSDGDLIITECTFKRNIAGDSGGGIFNNDGQLNLVNCTFTENNAVDGGGICTGSEPTMDNCMFIKNLAENSGGGIYNSQDETGRFIFESLAMSSYGRMPNYPGEPGITNCTFIENSASMGAGIYNNGANPVIMNCKFIRNAANLRGVTTGAGNSGGGMYNVNSSPAVTNCVFTDNFSAQDGGGMYTYGRSDLILKNCIFNGNRALLNGGALFINNSQSYLINCTLTRNSAEFGACMMFQSSSSIRDTVEIINCICRDGVNSIWKEGNTIINVSYSNIQYEWPGEGNIDEEPLFVDILGPDHTYCTEDDNLRLSPSSLCIDSGDPNYYISGPNETDFDGNRRIVSRRIDMGAYEFQGWIYVDDNAPYDTWRGEPEINYPEEDGTEARPFDTIQEAIDIAKEGYTVMVRPGVYEKIDFRGKAITVTGIEGAAVIEAPSTEDRFIFDNEDAFILDNDAVTFHTGEGPGSVIKNFVIRNSNIAISLNFSSPKIHNVTIADNNFGIAAYENSNPDIRNCILWNNRDGDLFQCEAQYSCIESRTQGEGNLHVNPLFVDTANGDYHLKSEGWRWNTNSQSWTWDDVTSRCIDAGDPDSPLGEELMSVPRDPDNMYGVNRYINMGAFGGTYQASMPPRDWLFPVDTTAPVPDPAQWAHPDGAPREINLGGGSFDFWVQMTATEATDASGLVEYFFECTTEPGFSSGWQTSNEYSVQIGRGEQLLRFRVKARDLYLNETEWSDERTAH